MQKSGPAVGHRRPPRALVQEHHGFGVDRVLAAVEVHELLQRLSNVTLRSVLPPVASVPASVFTGADVIVDDDDDEDNDDILLPRSLLDLVTFGENRLLLCRSYSRNLPNQFMTIDETTRSKDRNRSRCSTFFFGGSNRCSTKPFVSCPPAKNCLSGPARYIHKAQWWPTSHGPYCYSASPLPLWDLQGKLKGFSIMALSI